MNPILVSMHGPSDLNIKALSNFEAGIAFLTLVNRLSPGITFGQMMGVDSSGRLSGWWTDLGNAVGNVKDGVGDVIKDTASFIGGSTGDAVRLVTSEKVIDGASRIGQAYATSGGSEGVKQLLGGGDGASQFVDFISTLGDQFKSASTNLGGQNQASTLPGGPLPWLIGGVAVIVLALKGRK